MIQSRGHFQNSPTSGCFEPGLRSKQDFKCRARGLVSNKLVPTVLFCELMLATEIYRSDGVNARVWDQIKINKNERYHFFEGVPANCDALNEGIAECVADFKRFFVLPVDRFMRT